MSRRIPCALDIVSLSPQATRRLQAVEFSQRYGFVLACDALQIRTYRLSAISTVVIPFALLIQHLIVCYAGIVEGCGMGRKS